MTRSAEIAASGAAPRLTTSGLRSPLAGPFNLQLCAGCCATITGPSGSGKSLFLRMLADLDPSEGELRLNGRLRDSFSPPEWRRQVCYVPAEAGWWAERVHEHFAPATLATARLIATRLGLTEALFTAPVARLSSGERQRMGLTRAMALQPAVLLLDEPTGPLDPASVQRVEVLLRDTLAAGAALVLVTHDLLLAGRLGDQRYVMDERRLTHA